MKNFNKLWVLMLSLLMTVTVMVSCDDDLDTPDLGDTDGLLLADGFYLAKEGEDPLSAYELQSASVDAPSFSAMSRVGFMQGYMYLTAGSYTLVEVTDKEVTSSIGGALTMVTFDHDSIGNLECGDTSSYGLVATETDGASFAVATGGLYVVAYDTEMSEIVIDQLETIGIIGGATPGGWSEDTEMTGSFTAEGGAFSLTGVALEESEIKFRYNCRWGIDRRIDRTVDFDNTNGYSFFTNFGGAINNLLPGNEGANIQVEERGEYTITFDWSPSGVVASLTKTGDLTPITFDPDDYAWGIIGDATQGTTGDGGTDGWGSEKKFQYVNVDGVHTWRGVFPLEMTEGDVNGEFKFRTDDTWSKKFTPGTAGMVLTFTNNTESISDNGAENEDGSWFVDANPGFYYFEISTEDEGENWAMTIDEASWGVIGSATPDGWNSDTDLSYSDDLASASANMALVDGDVKFRVNDDWAYNWGGSSLDALTFNPQDNIPHTGSGNFDVTITTVDGGETYTATIQ